LVQINRLNNGYRRVNSAYERASYNFFVANAICYRTTGAVKLARLVARETTKFPLFARLFRTESTPPPYYRTDGPNRFRRVNRVLEKRSGSAFSYRFFTFRTVKEKRNLYIYIYIYTYVYYAAGGTSHDYVVRTRFNRYIIWERVYGNTTVVSCL